MENDKYSNKYESVYTKKVKAGKRRTYFFDVRKTKGNDYYITLTESTKKFNGHGYERHKLFLYKEDFNRFAEMLQETINHVKTDLMPDYDYDEYTRKNQEWEERRANETNEESNDETETSTAPLESEKDMEW